MDGWIPDDGLVEKVRLIGYPIKDLPEDTKDADRMWIVVGLSALGWTAQEIADRMDCSLRLVRNIKADNPAYAMATYAFSLRSQILAIAGTCRIEVSSMRHQLIAQSAQIDQLHRQRTDLIEQLQRQCAHAQQREADMICALQHQARQREAEIAHTFQLQIDQLRAQRAALVSQLRTDSCRYTMLERQPSTLTPRERTTTTHEEVHPL